VGPPSPSPPSQLIEDRDARNAELRGKVQALTRELQGAAAAAGQAPTPLPQGPLSNRRPTCPNHTPREGRAAGLFGH